MLWRDIPIIGTRQWNGRTPAKVIDRYRLEVPPLKRSERTRQDEDKALDRLKAVFGHVLPDNVRAQLCYKYVNTRRIKDGRPVEFSPSRHPLR